MIAELKSTESISLKEIIVDPKYQFRAAIDMDAVREWAELLLDGQEFPAVDVFDLDEGLVLVNGFQRLESHKAASKRKINCNIYSGSERDAIDFAISCNTKNGVRLTNADKKKAALFMLSDEEYSKLSDNEIARRIGATQPAVSKWRKEYLEQTGKERPKEILVRKKDGTKYTIDPNKQIEKRSQNKILGSPKPRPDFSKELPKEENNNLLDQFIAGEEEVDQFDKVTLGSIFQCGKHRAIYQSDLSKIEKLLDDYSLLLYSGSIEDFIENQDELINACDNVLVQVFTGSDIDSLKHINISANDGSILTIDGTPSYISHYCADPKEVKDLELTSYALFLDHYLKIFASKGESVCLIHPDNVTLIVCEKLGIRCDVIHGDSKAIQRELIAWSRLHGKPEKVK